MLEPTILAALVSTGLLLKYWRQVKDQQIILGFLFFAVTMGMFTPQMLMALYSPWPGYFHPLRQQSFWVSLEQHLGDRLEMLKHGSVIRPAPSGSLRDP